MSYRAIRLGHYIERITDKNIDDALDSLVGISEQKKFREPAGKVNRENLSNHLIINRNEFGYIPRMNPFKPLAIAISKFNYPVLLSPSYIAFRIINTDIINPDYLQLFFSRSEFDRYCAFNAWSSTRDTFDWENMLELEMPLPDIAMQKQFVAIYGNILKLQKSHEKSLTDLQLITDTFMDDLAKKSELQPLGDFVKQTDYRNRDLSINNLKGISIQKKFIDSKANMDGVSLSSYKIVDNGEFGYVTVTSRNGNKISLALNDDDPCVVSSTYLTFGVKDPSKLLPEFLLLWFKRPEFDRYARFNSWGSARETFDWSEMERVRIPVPSLATQKSIIAIHHVLESRKKLNDRLRDMLKQISPVLIKHAKDMREAKV